MPPVFLFPFVSVNTSESAFFLCSKVAKINSEPKQLSWNFQARQQANDKVCMLEFGFHSNALAAVAATTLPDSQVFFRKSWTTWAIWPTHRRCGNHAGWYVMTYMMAAEKMLESVIENFVFCSFSHGIVLNRRFRIHKTPDLTFFYCRSRPVLRSFLVYFGGGGQGEQLNRKIGFSGSVFAENAP